MCCHRSVPVCESLTLCLFFSLCRWWAGKKQSANIIRVRMKVTHDCCFFLFYIRFLRILTLKVIVPLLAWDVIKFDSTLSLCPASDWPTTTFCLWTRSARLWQQALLTRCRHRQVIPHFILIPVDVCFSTTQGFTSLQYPSTKCVPPIRDRCDSFLNLYFFDFSPRLVWRHLCLLVATANLKLQQTCAEQLLCREYNRRTSGLSV